MYTICTDPATAEIYTLSLHDALPIWPPVRQAVTVGSRGSGAAWASLVAGVAAVLVIPFVVYITRFTSLRLLEAGYAIPVRSEEHTSELQSHVNLVCRLLLEKKKQLCL